MARKEPDPMDVHVGSRIRLRRVILEMTQRDLGDAIGVTFQQIQKYERGLNRVGAGRLKRIAEVLSVPVEFFYKEIDLKRFDNPDYGMQSSKSSDSFYAVNETADNMSEESLLHYFRKIRSVQDKAAVFQLIKSLSEL